MADYEGVCPNSEQGSKETLELVRDNTWYLQLVVVSIPIVRVP